MAQLNDSQLIQRPFKLSFQSGEQPSVIAHAITHFHDSCVDLPGRVYVNTRPVLEKRFNDDGEVVVDQYHVFADDEFWDAFTKRKVTSQFIAATNRFANGNANVAAISA